MAINCCNGCVPPKRTPVCHSYCPEYKEQKEVTDREREEAYRKRKITGEVYAQKMEGVYKSKRKNRSYIAKRKIR